MDTFSQHLPPVDAALEAAISALEQEMPRLQAQSADIFALASAWAERHDAIIAATPPHARVDVEARLRRIGIRWGMMPGARMTTQFPALPPLPSGGKR